MLLALLVKELLGAQLPLQTFCVPSLPPIPSALPAHPSWAAPVVKELLNAYPPHMLDLPHASMLSPAYPSWAAAVSISREGVAGCITTPHAGAARRVCHDQPLAKQLRQQLHVRRLAATLTRTIELQAEGVCSASQAARQWEYRSSLSPLSQACLP